jgi:hypothetical protein
MKGRKTSRRNNKQRGTKKKIIDGEERAQN